jgi:hypothetical protein
VKQDLISVPENPIHSKKLILIMIIFSGCLKAKEKVSDEVAITVLN